MNLEKKLKLSNWNKFEEHAIVDEKQRLEGVESIKIIREILFRDDDQLPKYLGISNLLDKKIHERLQNG